MIDTHEGTATTLERVPTGIPGLDILLQGGFLRGGVYMVLARPGAGKTILGNQICSRHVAAGGRAVIVTLLTESHSRLMALLGTLSFFDPAAVGSTLSYVAAYQTLEQGGLKALLALLRQSVRDQRADFLMIDGLVTAGAMAPTEVQIKKFIHELQTLVELVGCTTLLLSSGEAVAGEQYAVRTMVDGLLELHLDPMGVEAVRSIEVTKMRGSRALLGRHHFDITQDGITVHPRSESVRGQAIDGPDRPVAPPAKLGYPGLDAMIAGGLRPGSVTLVAGGPGCGKTLLGLSFLGTGARLGESGLYFGFFETPANLCRRAEAIGLGLAGYVDSGLLQLTRHSPIGAFADALVEQLIAAVRDREVRRLFLDGLSGFRETLPHPERSRRFFGSLFNALPSMGVTTLVSDDIHTPGELEVPEYVLTAMLDNVIALRRVEVGGQQRKLVSISKLRAGAADPAVREFTIGARGFAVSSARPARKGGSRRPGRKAP